MCLAISHQNIGWHYMTKRFRRCRRRRRHYRQSKSVKVNEPDIINDNMEDVHMILVVVFYLMIGNHLVAATTPNTRSLAVTCYLENWRV